MNTNTILLLVIGGAAIVGLLAYEAYLQAQNNPATQVGKALGGALTSLL